MKNFRALKNLTLRVCFIGHYNFSVKNKEDFLKTYFNFVISLMRVWARGKRQICRHNGKKENKSKISKFLKENCQGQSLTGRGGLPFGVEKQTKVVFSVKFIVKITFRKKIIIICVVIRKLCLYKHYKMYIINLKRSLFLN